MKNTNNLVKVLLAITLFLSAPVILKADEHQKKTESDNATLKRHLEEIEFNFSEPIRQAKCELECIVNSNYRQFCKLKCKAQHLGRVGIFKIKQK